MTSRFHRSVQIKFYKIVLIVLLLATLISAYAYVTSGGPKLEALLAGLATGLFVAFIQYLLQWNEHREIEIIKQLGIRRILRTRDDKTHYKRLLDNAQTDIFVIGNTASRLFEDFAHQTRPDSRALLDALGRGVRVRVLLPKTEFLSADDRPRSEVAKKRMEEIAAKFPNFQRRFFAHAAAHSVMRIDKDCLVGPIFPGVRSKDSPTIHAYADSPLAEEYLRYFESEWNAAT